MHTERTYTEDEVAVIFERAAQAQKTAQQQAHRNTGLTLAELQQIGATAGIDPNFIARAATAMGHLEEVPPPAKHMGIPVGVSRTVNLPGPLSDEAWDQLVVDLRETFEAHGNVRQDGSLRQWTNGNLKVLAEPTREGQRLRLQTMNANGRANIGVGLISLFFGLGILILALALGKGSLVEMLSIVALIVSAGIANIGYAAFKLPRWAKTRQQQMEAIALHAVEYTNPDLEALSDEVRSPQLDLEALEDPVSAAPQKTAERTPI